MIRRIALDDLSLHSPWPSRLLGFEKWTKKSKTAEEVAREFDLEKWPGILARIQESPGITIQGLEALIMGGQDIPFWADQQLFVGPWTEVHRLHLDLYEDTLVQYLHSSLVELGAGYGSVILNLAVRPSFHSQKVFAAELTTSGIEAIKQLAANGHTAITTGHCDLRLGVVNGIEIPEDSVIFTCCSAHYIPTLEPTFVSFLASLKPRAVVHFEPCYEHHSDGHLLSILCKRYIEINGYNRNLLSIIHEADADGLISILEERRNVIGANPLLPISVVAWKPIHPKSR